MAITVPASGDPITATYGAAVANQLNQFVAISMAADVSTNSTSWSNLATCAVESGKTYCGTIIFRWSPNATNQGGGVGFNHPGGSIMGYMIHFDGAGAGSVADFERITGTDTGGPSSSDNTNTRESVVFLWYSCTTSGTLAMRGSRQGTTGSPGITYSKGSGGLLVVT